MKAPKTSADVVTVPRALLHKIEDDSIVAKRKMAVLIFLSEGQATYERGGTEDALQKLTWEGIEDLSRDVLRYLEEVERAGEFHVDGCVMIPDESLE